MSASESAVLHNWQLACVKPGTVPLSDQTDGLEALVQELDWFALDYPQTVASWMASGCSSNGKSGSDCNGTDDPLQRHRLQSFLSNRFPTGSAALAIDSWDWLYRCEFTTGPSEKLTHDTLVCEGLAGLCDIWLNGELIGNTDNMFRTYRLPIVVPAAQRNEMVFIFRSVDHFLSLKRARPRWKTRLVDHQNLRFLRRALLGRIPGWASGSPAVGPYRSIFLQNTSADCQESLVQLDQLSLTTQLLSKRTFGRVGILARIYGPEALTFGVSINGQITPLQAQRSGNLWVLDAHIPVKHPNLWWPHTEGEQGENTLELTCTQINQKHGSRTVVLARKCVRFKTVEYQAEADSGWQINGRSVFLRGACWTTAHVHSLSGDREKLLRILHTARNAGMNVLRIGGTMLYESNTFYELCDQLGILVWQDFMFANMDYPFDEPAFRDNCIEEVSQQLQRLAGFGCVFAYCGGSEIEQQAAMTGVASSSWRHVFFDETMAELCQRYHPQTVYFPATPCGGALPFYTSEGLTHYYGVGAYKRDFSDLYVADVKFATECLAFSNTPRPSMLKKHFGCLFPPPHLPDWKAGVCRDHGAGWDFEDIRDHYIQQLFGVHPVALRSENLERYYAISDVVTGEIMSRVYQFWRSSLSRCKGALIWYLNDLLPGAGWGVVDADGYAKPALDIVAQSLQPLQIVWVDKGLEGFWVEVINDSQADVSGQLCIDLWQAQPQPLAVVQTDIHLRPGQRRGWFVEQLLGGFYDVGHCYKFGPATHQLLSARLLNGQQLLASAEIYSSCYSLPEIHGVELNAHVREQAGHWWLDLESSHCLQRAVIEMRGYTVKKNYLNLIAGQRYVVEVVPECSGERFRGTLSALNTPQVFSIHGP